MHEDLMTKPRRRRRTYTAQFKAELVAQCMDPTVSQAAVAIEHDMNPNVLRRWVIEHERLGLHGLDVSADGDEGTVPATPANWMPFVPVQPPTQQGSVAVSARQEPSSIVQRSATIEVQLAARGLAMTIHWPATEHQALAQWTRQVLA
jgi:transposase-like protein